MSITNNQPESTPTSASLAEALAALRDSESRQAMQKLKDIQQQYFTLVESLPQLVWTTKPDGVPDYVSQQWHDYTGLSLEETLEKGWGFLLPSEDQERAIRAWQKAVGTGESYSVEYRLRREDGKFRWFLARGVPIKDAGGEVIRWFGTCTDIDDQKREAEKQRFLAQLSEETRPLRLPDEVTWAALRMLGEHLHAARSTYNEVEEEHDRVTARRDYCLEGDSLLGTFPLSAFGAALMEDLRAGRTAVIVDAALDPRTAPVFETTYRVIGIRSFIAAPLIKEGKLVTILSVNMKEARDWEEEEAALVEEVAERTWLAVENARLYQVTQREVEERKRMEEHSHRLAAIVESSQDAIVSKDLDGIVTSWNPAAERIYGYTAQEMIGQSKSLVIPPDLPDELATTLRKIRAGERIEHYETVRLRKDGRRISLSISVSPVRNAEGEIIGASTIARDITERVEHLREIEALNARLQRSIKETHHRVKNNLQIISSLVEVQISEAQEHVPVAAMSRIGQHTRSLAAIHDLLTHETRFDISADSISSRAAMDRLIPLLQATTGGRRILANIAEIRFPVREGASLALLVSEIVSNAVKHGSGDIKVTLSVDGETARLEISDDGPGFPPGFDPQTAANTGLALIDSTGRHDLGGTISYENGPGGGARVVVTFPVPATL